MSVEATKVAKEEYSKAIEKVNEEFERSTVIGCKRTDGKVVYRISPGVQTLKTMMEIGKAEFSYVGQIKLQKTKKGLVPTLEEVDMSKVKTERYPESLIKKLEKRGEEMRKEREQNMQKLRSYSSQIPDEIKSMVNGLGSETNYAIMACLLKEGEQSYAQLKEKIGLDDRTLRNSIVKMEQSALVNEKGPIYFIKNKKTEKTVGVTVPPQESTFEATNLGKSLMKNLFKVYELPPKRRMKK
jgi:lambda repressor-like predicted transcriptional regulator